MGRGELVLHVCCDTPLTPMWSYLEADSRGLVAMHGDGGMDIQSPEHTTAERVPGHRGELLRDGGLRPGADLLIVRTGRKENNSV